MNRRFVLCALSCLAFAFNSPVNASLVNVGDSQTFTIHSWVSGDPALFPSTAVSVSVTAGKYQFYLEDSYWNICEGKGYDNVVGGISLVTSDLKSVMYDPMADGTNPNNTTRTMFFSVSSDQTLLAGVADNYPNDNVGDAIFTLTKMESVPEPATVGLIGMGLFFWKTSKRKRSSL